MAYCTLEDIQKHLQETDLGQLTDDTGAGVVDAAKVAEAIRAADALIDGYLRARYTLPLVAASGVITDISVHLAIYELYNRKPSLLIGDQLAKDREFYLKLLGQIGSGVFDPGLSEAGGGAVEPGSSALCSKTAADAIYTARVWGGFL